jgi:threonine/homoserine/homoserine lactone efflux protein
MAALGASFADFVYVFAAVYGLTKFYSSIKPFIPYILFVGAFFLVYLGIKIVKTKIDLEHIEDKSHMSERIKKQQRGGFWTGFMLNFLNPTLFLGWLTSSFIIISLVTSLGFDTGGLEQTVSSSYNTLHKTDKDSSSDKTFSFLKADSIKIVKHQPSAEEIAHYPKYYSELLSASYAFFLAVGSIAWFFFLAFMLVKHRHRVSVKAINRTIQVLGIGLCIFGLLLGYKGIHILIQH